MTTTAYTSTLALEMQAFADLYVSPLIARVETIHKDMLDSAADFVPATLPDGKCDDDCKGTVKAAVALAAAKVNNELGFVLEQASYDYFDHLLSGVHEHGATEEVFEAFSELYEYATELVQGLEENLVKDVTYAFDDLSWYLLKTEKFDSTSYDAVIAA